MSDFNDQSNNPYTPLSNLSSFDPTSLPAAYGGIGRLAYFGWSFLAGMVYNLAAFMIGASGESAIVLMIPVLLVYLGVLFWIVAQRMINTGYSPWWCLGMLVPILNILVAVRCIACPEGYADHRTLDTPGKIIVGLFLGLFALVVLALFYASVG